MPTATAAAQSGQLPGAAPIQDVVAGQVRAPQTALRVLSLIGTACTRPSGAPRRPRPVRSGTRSARRYPVSTVCSHLDRMVTDDPDGYSPRRCSGLWQRRFLCARVRRPRDVRRHRHGSTQIHGDMIACPITSWLPVVAGDADVSTAATELRDQLLAVSRSGRARGAPDRRLHRQHHRDRARHHQPPASGCRRGPDDDRHQERQDRPAGDARP